MTEKKKCCFLFFDYVDYDVFLNARIFYHLAGYRIVGFDQLSSCSLVVLFRGIPSQTFYEYSGLVHFYDYVREHDINIASFFPCAFKICKISLEKVTDNVSVPNCVYGYLPVFPSLWQFSFPFSKRSALPVHVSNYKPLKNDSYQNILINKIKSNLIKVYGSKWDRVQIDARPLSYLSANLILSKVRICYGLMYPYQRGKSLSGRMWQAPLQGCLVISEMNTNLFSSPGVYEVATYDEFHFVDYPTPIDLAKQASEFWSQKTDKLAMDLNLSLDYRLLPWEVACSRLLLFCQHLEFTYKQLFDFKTGFIPSRIRQFVRILSARI
ncbi:MAG: hypothetical protein ACK587_07470 [Cyanobacteriota bacterium]